MSDGTGTLLDLINAAISQGAKPGAVLSITDGDGKSYTVTLGETIPAPGRKMLVAIAMDDSATRNR